MTPHSLGPTDGPTSAPAAPDVFFDGSGHVRILRHLEQAIAQDDRLVVLTGDEGVGKTTVIQRLLRGLDRNTVWCVLLSAMQLDGGDLAGPLARAFGAPTSAASAAALQAGLRRHLAAHANGRTVLAVIDDAQALSHEAMAELGELTREGSLRVLLVGRPALRMILARQLPLQPASLSCHLEPLLETETPAYIEHRLRSVGWNGSPEFTTEAQTLIYRFSRGVPQRIDRLCARLLRAAHQHDEHTVAGDAVRRIARPRRNDSTIPMLTSAVDEPLSSGWAATSGLPPDSELPRWARTPAEAPATIRPDASAALRQRRIGLVLSALVIAAVAAVWAWHSLEPAKVDASMTTTLPPLERPAPIVAPAPATTPTQTPQPTPQPAPQPQPPAPAGDAIRTPATPVEPPRPAAPPPRAAATTPPPKRSGTPVAAPSPVPGPCTATVAALGLCTSTENPP